MHKLCQWKPHWFQNRKKSGVGFNHVSPDSCQWGVLENQEEKQKEKANKGEE
jgi:hypothetical protein